MSKDTRPLAYQSPLCRKLDTQAAAKERQDRMNGSTAVLEDVTTLALQLSPVDRVKLVERLLPVIEHDVTQSWQIERDSVIIEQAKAEATGFVTLDEMLDEYQRETGHDLKAGEGGHEL